MILCFSQGEDTVCAWKCIKCMFVLVYQHPGPLYISWTFIDQIFFHKKMIFSLNRDPSLGHRSSCVSHCVLCIIIMQAFESSAQRSSQGITIWKWRQRRCPCHVTREPRLMLSWLPLVLRWFLHIWGFYRPLFLLICCRYLGNPNREAVLLEK